MFFFVFEILFRIYWKWCMFFTEVALVFRNVSKRFTKLNNVEMNKNETNLIYFYTWTIIRWVLAHSLSLSLSLKWKTYAQKYHDAESLNRLYQWTISI